MTQNFVTAELTDAVKDEIITKIAEITALLPFVINLSPEERKQIPKMGDKSIAFVEKSLELAAANTELVPPYLSIEELGKDFQLSKQLFPIQMALASLSEKVSDTQMAAGSDAYAASLIFYNTMKGAARAGVPGVDTAVSQLKERFPYRKKKEEIVAED